MWEEIITEES